MFKTITFSPAIVFFLKYLLTNMYKCIYFSEDKSEGYAIYKKKLQNYLKFILNHG